MKKALASLFITLLIGNTVLFGQLSGTYTINGGMPTSGSNFNTFSAAAAVLNSAGVSGAVTINVVANSGPYNEQISLDSVGGLSSTYTLTINGNGNLIYHYVTAANKQVLKVNGCPYVTIDGLHVKATSFNDAVGIQVMNGSDHSVVKNCVIDLDSVVSSTSVDVVGIVVNGGTGWTFGSGNTDSVTVEGNTVYGGTDGLDYGIKVTGGGFPATYSSGHKVIDNIIYDAKYGGIILEYVDDVLAQGNDISRPTATSGDFYGINVYAGVSNAIVENNLIHNTHDAVSGAVNSYGIRINNAAPTSGNDNLIRNNLLYNFNGNGNDHGIYVFNSTYAKIYHNTISFDNTSATSGNTYGFYHTSSPNSIEFVNNIVSITRGGSGVKYAMFFNNGTPSITSNFNVLYVNSLGSGNQYTGYWNSTNYQSLANWQAANSGVFDTNSVSTNPFFLSTNTSNLRPSSSIVNDAGTPLSLVPTDITGFLRDTISPDPGAYESTPPPLDAGIASIDSIGASCPGNLSVWATLTNFGLDTIKTVTINWSVNGAAQTPLSLSPSLPLLQSMPVFLGTISVSNGVSYDFMAHTSNPNGQADTLNFNDTSSYLGFETALSGYYTIGGSSADFNTISDAVNDLNKRGICASVFFDVDSAWSVYTDQISFLQIKGSNDQDTIVFEGNGALIDINVTASDLYAVKFDNAAYVTFRNFDINALGTNSGDGGVIYLTNGSHDLHIHDCLIETQLLSTSSFETAVIMASSDPSAAGVANFCLFENNTLRSSGMRNGIKFIGQNNALGCYGNIFRNNVILDPFFAGIYLTKTDSTIIYKNDISRPSKLILWTFRGLYLYQKNQNTLVYGNTIHNASDQDVNEYFSCVGIDVQDCDAPLGKENKIINNLIYEFNNRGLHVGLNTVNSDGLHFYHNTVSLDFNSPQGNTRGIDQQLNATNLEFKNNIISVDRGGSGSHYAYYFQTGSSSILSDYNGLNLDTNNNNAYLGKLGTLNFKTLSDWKNFIANANRDQNSQFGTPNFANPSQENYTPHNCFFNNSGDTLGIELDILDSVRNMMAPDLGAIEFDVEFSNVTLGNDTTVCIEKTFELTAAVGFVSYKWSTGGSGQSTSIFALDLGLGSHTVSVTAIDTNGCESMDSLIVTVIDCSPPGGISEGQSIKSLGVYPIPTEKDLTLEFESVETGVGSIEILNSKGQVLIGHDLSINAGVNKKSFDLSTFSPGIYLIRMTQNGQLITKRFIKK